MKRFQFRLERVLSVKERRERLAEMRQQQARARWEAARAECAKIEEQLADAAAHAAERLQQAAALGTWRAYYERTASLDDLLAAAQRRLIEVENQLQEANRQRIQASLEVEALRDLRAKEWQNYQKQAAQQQQNRLDEIGLQRWLAAREKGPFGSPDPAEGNDT